MWRWLLPRGEEDEALDAVRARLATLSQVQPDAAARDRIWQQAQVKAVQAAQPAPRRRPRWSWRTGLLTALLVITLLGFGSGAYAAGRSLPGEPFYGVKREVEALWLTVTPAPQQGEAQLRLLERRATEVEILLYEGRPIPAEVLAELESMLALVAEDPAALGLTRGRALPYVERLRVRFLGLSLNYPEVRSLGRLLAASSYARDTLWGP